MASTRGSMLVGQLQGLVTFYCCCRHVACCCCLAQHTSIQSAMRRYCHISIPSPHMFGITGPVWYHAHCQTPFIYAGLNCAMPATAYSAATGQYSNDHLVPMQPHKQRTHNTSRQWLHLLLHASPHISGTTGPVWYDAHCQTPFKYAGLNCAMPATAYSTATGQYSNDHLVPMQPHKQRTHNTSRQWLHLLLHASGPHKVQQPNAGFTHTMTGPRLVLLQQQERVNNSLSTHTDTVACVRQLPLVTSHVGLHAPAEHRKNMSAARGCYTKYLKPTWPPSWLGAVQQLSYPVAGCTHIHAHLHICCYGHPYSLC
jgi:hypothetical protein